VEATWREESAEKEPREERVGQLMQVNLGRNLSSEALLYMMRSIGEREVALTRLRLGKRPKEERREQLMQLICGVKRTSMKEL
jgi:seryl-tRNA(Sec) selenium transferase